MENNIASLLELLSLYGGKIICTSQCDPEEIRQARASGRMYVDENNIGFIWDPSITKFPQTDEEVEFFEKWYPIDIDVPEGFYEKMWERIISNEEEEIIQLTYGRIITDRYTDDVFYFNNESDRWLINKTPYRYRYANNEEQEILIRSRKNSVTINIADRLVYNPDEQGED